MPRRSLRFDRRLVGTWMSDRGRTFRHWKPKPGCSPASLRRLKRIFGRLVVRWGYRYCHTDFDGFRTRLPYEVVASDADSLVIRYPDEDRLVQIHFEGEEYYYILVGGSMCEYFRRVPPAR